MKIAASFIKSIVKRLTNNVVLVTFFFSLLFLLTSYFILHTSYFGNAHAQACDAQSFSDQETINNINKCAIEKDIFDDKIFNLNQISGTTDSLYNLLIGSSLLHPETNKVTQNWGALAGMNRLVAGLYTAPPVSGVQYFASEFQKFNPAQPVYAQADTIGFNALTPVQGLWTVFRNASYVGFVIVFVIIGFMIMLRAHISPQAVATIQDSIPRLVVALILVTFSYAIAGLMLDLMFLFLNIAINVLATANPSLISADKASQIAFEKNIFSVIISGWGDIVTTTADAIKNALDGIKFGLSIPFIGEIVGWAISGIIGVVVGIAVLYVMFRIFLALLMGYVMIIILTMVAPFFFLIQALPGNNGAKEWFKQMAANVAVFPTAALMIIFAGILAGIGAFGATKGAPFGEEQLTKFPLLFGGFEAKTFMALLGIGFLLATPEAINMVKGFISGQGRGGGGGFGGAAVGGAIGGALGAGYAPVGAALGRAGQFAKERQPLAKYARAGQIKREQAAYKQAGYSLPGVIPTTKGEVQGGGKS